jgi:hypothetical protein
VPPKPRDEEMAQIFPVCGGRGGLEDEIGRTDHFLHELVQPKVCRDVVDGTLYLSGLKSALDWRSQ